MPSGPITGPRRPGSFGGGIETGARPPKIVFGPVTTTAGTALVGATVFLHDFATGARVQTGTTDATGTVTFYVNNAGVYYIYGYKLGSPNVTFSSDVNLVSS